MAAAGCITVAGLAAATGLAGAVRAALVAVDGSLRRRLRSRLRLPSRLCMLETVEGTVSVSATTSACAIGSGSAMTGTEGGATDGGKAALLCLGDLCCATLLFGLSRLLPVWPPRSDADAAG